MKTLSDLFLHELKDVYDAEHQIVAALPEMAKAAGSPDLRAAFETHLEQSRAQIERLEQVFKATKQKASRVTCEGMKGIIKEGKTVLEDEMSDDVRDAALIAAAQRVEHYEMAGYGTLRTYAYLLGHTEAAELLQQTLEEEELTDKLLSQLATTINRQAQ
jgi:ferritin-like metal-binding protein YciE